MLNNLHIKPGDKIFTYNMDFICYIFQLGWENNVLCYYYYQRLPNWIQNPIFIQEQGKPTLFQDIYALITTTGNGTANATVQDRWRNTD